MPWSRCTDQNFPKPKHWAPWFWPATKMWSHQMWHLFKRSNCERCIYRIVTSPIFRTTCSKIYRHFWPCIWMTIHWIRYVIALANYFEYQVNWSFSLIYLQTMNVNAFKYLVNLRVFNIPKIDRKIAGKLCEQLQSLDILRLTSETFDVSCFELMSGSTFDESTIRIGQTTLSFQEFDSDGKEKLSQHCILHLFQWTFNFHIQICIKNQQIHRRLHHQNQPYWQSLKKQLMHLKRVVKISDRKYRLRRWAQYRRMKRELRVLKVNWVAANRQRTM